MLPDRDVLLPHPICFRRPNDACLSGYSKQKAWKRRKRTTRHQQRRRQSTAVQNHGSSRWWAPGLGPGQAQPMHFPVIATVVFWSGLSPARAHEHDDQSAAGQTFNMQRVIALAAAVTVVGYVACMMESGGGSKTAPLLPVVDAAGTAAETASFATLAADVMSWQGNARAKPHCSTATKLACSGNMILLVATPDTWDNSDAPSFNFKQAAEEATNAVFDPHCNTSFTANTLDHTCTNVGKKTGCKTCKKNGRTCTVVCDRAGPPRGSDGKSTQGSRKRATKSKKVNCKAQFATVKWIGAGVHATPKIHFTQCGVSGPILFENVLEIGAGKKPNAHTCEVNEHGNTCCN